MKVLPRKKLLDRAREYSDFEFIIIIIIISFCFFETGSLFYVALVVLNSLCRPVGQAGLELTEFHYSVFHFS